jgi:hypothetical protein
MNCGIEFSRIAPKKITRHKKRHAPCGLDVFRDYSVISVRWQGTMEEWKNGRLEEWKVGRLEGWKNGRLEGWKNEEWKLAGAIAHNRPNNGEFSMIG